MDREIVKRLNEYITSEKLNAHSFATSLGYTNSEKIQRLFRNSDAKPSYDIIFDIANKFVNLSLEWLITGEGKMIKQNASIPSVNNSKEDHQKITQLEKEILQLKQELNEKNKQTQAIPLKYSEYNPEIDLLKSQLHEKNIQIEMLKEQLSDTKRYLENYIQLLNTQK